MLGSTKQTVPVLLSILLLAGSAEGQRPAPPDMDDITCYKVNEPCDTAVPANWAQGQVYARGRAVCKLHIFARPNGELPVEKRGVGTGWLLDFANRDDLIVTCRHCVDSRYPFPLDFGAAPESTAADSTYDEPEWVAGDVFDHVTVEFALEYAMDCQCAAMACPGPANPCDTPEAAMCTVPSVWSSTCVAWPGDGCDWAVIAVEPNANNQLPGQLFPKLPLGTYTVGTEVVIPQHPQGRCKEVAFNGTGVIQAGGWSFDHFVATQSGSSGSPLLYLDNQVAKVAGVHFARVPAIPNLKRAVLAQSISADIDEVVRRLERPDHYMTYTVIDTVEVEASVVLTDQFLTNETFAVKKLEKLLVPADKIHPPDVFPRVIPELHYKWWTVEPTRPANETVRVLNQFSDNTVWTIDSAQFLLAPALKERGHSSDPPDTLLNENHYLCYSATEDTTRNVPIQLIDQFQTASVVVRDAVYLCNPCRKDSLNKSYPIVWEDVHLALYKIDPFWQPDSVSIEDQFGLHRVMIKQDGSNQEYIAVPSIKTEIPTSVGDVRVGAGTIRLGPPRPNPSGDGATVELTLVAPAWAKLTVFDTQGRRVRELYEGRLPAGTTPLTWDGRTDGGNLAASGVYFMRAEAAGSMATERVVLRR
jgi:hypothetical protein